MSTELAGIPADRQPSTRHPERGRSGAFTLPVSTSFRFALLIATVVASSFFVYEGIYLATPRGYALRSLMLKCRAHALAHEPSGAIAYASALHQASVCYSGAERVEAWWGLLGIGVLLAAAGAIFLAQPWWYRRRMQLTALAGAGSADLVSRLEGVRQRATTEPVVWQLQPLNSRLSAFAFGRPGRRYVAISGGAAVASARKPAAFDAVIMHELAHIKNRDIDQTYLALAIWRAFVIVALLPLAVLLIFSPVLGEPQHLIWRVAVMALIVYTLRNAILRSREFDADARARQLDPGIELSAVLAGMPPRTGRRAWHLGWTHPSGQERAAALRDPAPLYRFGFWDGLAIGLAAALGASAAREIVTLLTTTYGVRLVVPAIIFAAFAGPALTVAMWRKQLLEADSGAVKGWAAGLGLGLGLALGPVIALSTVSSQVLAPDQLNPPAVGVLAVWAGLAVLIFMPFPVWAGHWADAWQLRADRTASRVPARGGLIAAAFAAWVVMAVGLYLLLWNVTWFLGGLSAADLWHGFPLLRDVGFQVTVWSGGWLVCLVVVAVPIAAAVTNRQWRRSGDVRDAAVRRRPWMPTVLLCVAGCLVVVALTLAVGAVTHARIAELVRWSPTFLVRLVSFDEQAIVVIAVVCALIAAARARSALGVALSVAVGAAVAAVGALALSNLPAIGRCFPEVSIQYAHPPAGSCLASTDILVLHQVVLGACLVSILFVPAGYAAGMFMRRRNWGLPTSVVALGWFAAAVAIIVAVTGTALWGPRASAYGVAAAGSIGNDGWIRGDGYDVRLIPGWYDITRVGGPGLIYFAFPFDGAKIESQSLVGVNSVKIADYRSFLLRLGARRTVLDGAPGLLLTRSGLPSGVLEQWFIVRGPAVHLITLYRSPEWPQDSPFLRDDFARMLHTWHWTA